MEEFPDNAFYRLETKTPYEQKPLGSARTTAANRDFVAGKEAFLIFYAHNVTNVNLEKTRHFHKGCREIFTMEPFKANKPKECGIAQPEGSGLVVDFAEKSDHPKSNLTQAGVYVAGPQIFDYIPNKK